MKITDGELKILLRESLIGYIVGTGLWKTHEKYDVYKNPRSIKKMDSDIRGVIGVRGDFFVVNDSRNVIHSKLTSYLQNRGLIGHDVVNVIRHGMTEDFYLSESYYDLYSLDWSFNFKYGEAGSYERLSNIIKTCREKNPTYTFFERSINDRGVNIMDYLGNNTY